MSSRLCGFTCAAVALLFSVPPTARAQFAVIDVASLSQLVSEVRVLEQQLSTARSELTQAQSEYQSITGPRGMERLLGGTVRNYLPGDWPAVQSVLQGSVRYPQLSTDLQVAVKALAVLSATQLAALPPPATAQLQARRQTIALLQSLSHQSLANSSGRFAAIQQLINAIAQAPDQKAILELLARIAAEQDMLQNENTKLQVLYQGVQAQDLANGQSVRELTVAGHGQFQNRFQPQP
ncbi:MAG: type IV secretion system family protein [Gammaproteobacteria bacterium]|nr:type IV secretion system family protein [Gammaproteobacteria bacterium]